MLHKEIDIQDILIVVDKGEARSSSKFSQLPSGKTSIREPKHCPSDARAHRMAVLIEDLAKRANNTHKNRQLERKRRKEETGETPSSLVTRLVMNEFSLYTKDKPLSIQEYLFLIRKINRIANTLSPNVHLLIATLPVLWPNNKLYNCALYVQSPIAQGEEPVIHHFFKESTSAIDCHYADSEGNLYAMGNNYAFGEAMTPANVLKDSHVTLNDVNQYQSAIKIITAEGKSYITLIEICLDHQKAVAERNLLRLILQLKACDQGVPHRVSQIISSDSIILEPDNMLVPVTQVDPRFLDVQGSLARKLRSIDTPAFGENVTIKKYHPKQVEKIGYEKVTQMMTFLSLITVEEAELMFSSSSNRIALLSFFAMLAEESLANSETPAKSKPGSTTMTFEQSIAVSQQFNYVSSWSFFDSLQRISRRDRQQAEDDVNHYAQVQQVGN